ncbi:MAG TPA: hypothetical protein VIO64_09810 [Pseudobacteroides sp.]|uniref:hypothetical protein n=1 Tax=Pseudobacteroides sp. TaxID=1968840 RepID=UPI002F94D280
MRILENYIDLDNIENILVTLSKNYESIINSDLAEYKNQTISAKIELDYSDKINAEAIETEMGDITVKITLSYFRELEAFYKTVFYKENPGFYRSISAESYFNESRAVFYLDLMLKLSLSVFILHEYGHIYNGHLLYIMKAKNLNSARMTNNTYEEFSTNTIDSITYQSMEWNADDFASTRLISIFTHDDNIKILNLDNSNCIKSKEHMLFIIMFSSYIAFALMGLGEKKQFSENDFRLKKHLPKRFRAKKFIRNLIEAYNHFNEKTEFSDNQLLSAVESTMETWVNLYKKIAENKDNWDTSNNTNELDEEHSKYYDLVEFHYLNKLPTILEPFERLRTLM